LAVDFLFWTSYPTHKQFDTIGNVIVKFLKLPLIVENIVSLFNIYNEHYLSLSRPYGKMLSKQNLNENVQNIQIIFVFKNIGWHTLNLDQDDQWNVKLEQQHNATDINKYIITRDRLSSHMFLDDDDNIARWWRIRWESIKSRQTTRQPSNRHTHTMTSMERNIAFSATINSRSIHSRYSQRLSWLWKHSFGKKIRHLFFSLVLQSLLP
jgi:hypothetical protein